MVPLQHRPGRQKAETKAETHRSVDIFGAGHTLIDQRKGFTRQGMLQPVGEKAGLVLAHQHRHQAAVAHRVAKCFSTSQLAARTEYDFDQRHQMRRHEEMQAIHALLARKPFGNCADREARAVAGQDAVRPRQPFQIGKQGLLQRQLFRNAFDHQVDGRPVDIGQIGSQAKAFSPLRHADIAEALGHMAANAGAPCGIALDHGDDKTAARQHHRDIGAHRSTTDDHGLGADHRLVRFTHVRFRSLKVVESRNSRCIRQFKNFHKLIAGVINSMASPWIELSMARPQSLIQKR